MMADIMIGGLLTALNALLIFFLKRLHGRVDKQDEIIMQAKTTYRKEMELMKKDMNDFRLNYINRFEVASKERNDMRIEFKDTLNEFIIVNEKSHALIIDTIRTEIAKVVK